MMRRLLGVLALTAVGAMAGSVLVQLILRHPPGGGEPA